MSVCAPLSFASTNRQLLTLAVPIIAAAGIGYAGWQESSQLLSLALLFPFVWSKAVSRPHGWLIAFAYFGMVTRGVPGGAQVFFGEHAAFAAGWLLWIACNAVLALPWGLLWHREMAEHYGTAFWRTGAALVLIIVPPLGLFGFGNPLTAAGAIFPSFGWFGLGLVLLILPCHQTAWRQALLGVLVLIGLAQTSDPLRIEGWQAIDTHFPRLQNEDVDYSADFLRHQEIRRQIEMHPGPAVTVLPEGAAGYWTDAAADWWKAYDQHLTNQGRTLLFGAEIPKTSGGYVNAIVVLGKEAHDPIAQRVPVPIAMWQPWHDSGARPSWFASGISQIGMTRIATVICYEQFILWPLLLSFSQQPQVLVAVANDWWARDTAIPEQQRAIMTSWSRLFHIPLIQAVNR